MAIQSVVKMGNSKLASPSIELENFTQIGRSYPGLQALITDMLDTMNAEKGVGIAAPQIGHNIRVVMFGLEQNNRYPDESSVPFTIIINPAITPLTKEEVDGWEGCLSVPGLRGLVPRYQKISYSGFDLEGNRIERIVEGFHARVVQHEVDHLDGILYPQRIKDFSYFGFEDEFNV